MDESATTVASADRRNHASRAEATRLVLEALVAAPDAAGSWPAGGGLPAGVAERILKRFALRGLARVTPAGWEPTPPLLCHVPLQPCEDAEHDPPAPTGG